MKTGGDVFTWALCINAAILNLLSLYKFSTFADLKSSFVRSNFVLLWTDLKLAFVGCAVFSDSFDKNYPKLS